MTVGFSGSDLLEVWPGIRPAIDVAVDGVERRVQSRGRRARFGALLRRSRRGGSVLAGCGWLAREALSASRRGFPASHTAGQVPTVPGPAMLATGPVRVHLLAWGHGPIMPAAADGPRQVRGSACGARRKPPSAVIGPGCCVIALVHDQTMSATGAQTAVQLKDDRPAEQLLPSLPTPAAFDDDQEPAT